MSDVKLFVFFFILFSFKNTFWRQIVWAKKSAALFVSCGVKWSRIKDMPMPWWWANITLMFSSLDFSSWLTSSLVDIGPLEFAPKKRFYSQCENWYFLFRDFGDKFHWILLLNEQSCLSACNASICVAWMRNMHILASNFQSIRRVAIRRVASIFY